MHRYILLWIIIGINIVKCQDLTVQLNLSNVDSNHFTTKSESSKHYKRFQYFVKSGYKVNEVYDSGVEVHKLADDDTFKNADVYYKEFLPQLVKLELTKSNESKHLYFKRENGVFTSVDENQFQQLVDSADFIDRSLSLDLDRGFSDKLFVLTKVDVFGGMRDQFVLKSALTLVKFTKGSEVIVDTSNNEKLSKLVWFKADDKNTMLQVVVSNSDSEETSEFFEQENGVWKSVDESRVKQLYETTPSSPDPKSTEDQSETDSTLDGDSETDVPLPSTPVDSVPDNEQGSDSRESTPTPEEPSSDTEKPSSPEDKKEEETDVQDEQQDKAEEEGEEEKEEEEGDAGEQESPKGEAPPSEEVRDSSEGGDDHTQTPPQDESQEESSPQDQESVERTEDTTGEDVKGPEEAQDKEEEKDKGEEEDTETREEVSERRGSAGGDSAKPDEQESPSDGGSGEKPAGDTVEDTADTTDATEDSGQQDNLEPKDQVPDQQEQQESEPREAQEERVEPVGTPAQDESQQQSSQDQEEQKDGVEEGREGDTTEEVRPTTPVQEETPTTPTQEDQEEGEQKKKPSHVGGHSSSMSTVLNLEEVDDFVFSVAEFEHNNGVTDKVYFSKFSDLVGVKYKEFERLANTDGDEQKFGNVTVTFLNEEPRALKLEVFSKSGAKRNKYYNIKTKEELDYKAYNDLVDNLGEPQQGQGGAAGEDAGQQESEPKGETPPSEGDGDTVDHTVQEEVIQEHRLPLQGHQGSIPQDQVPEQQRRLSQQQPPAGESESGEGDTETREEVSERRGSAGADAESEDDLGSMDDILNKYDVGGPSQQPPTKPAPEPRQEPAVDQELMERLRRIHRSTDGDELTESLPTGSGDQPQFRSATDQEPQSERREDEEGVERGQEISRHDPGKKRIDSAILQHLRDRSPEQLMEELEQQSDGIAGTETKGDITLDLEQPDDPSNFVIASFDLGDGVTSKIYFSKTHNIVEVKYKDFVLKPNTDSNEESIGELTVNLLNGEPRTLKLVIKLDNGLSRDKYYDVKNKKDLNLTSYNKLTDELKNESQGRPRGKELTLNLDVDQQAHVTVEVVKEPHKHPYKVYRPQSGYVFTQAIFRNKKLWEADRLHPNANEAKVYSQLGAPAYLVLNTPESTSFENTLTFDLVLSVRTQTLERDQLKHLLETGDGEYHPTFDLTHPILHYTYIVQKSQYKEFTLREFSVRYGRVVAILDNGSRVTPTNIVPFVHFNVYYYNNTPIYVVTDPALRANYFFRSKLGWYSSLKIDMEENLQHSKQLLDDPAYAPPTELTLNFEDPDRTKFIIESWEKDEVFFKTIMPTGHNVIRHMTCREASLLDEEAGETSAGVKFYLKNGEPFKAEVLINTIRGKKLKFKMFAERGKKLWLNIDEDHFKNV